jgi:hypothetical protein
LLLLAQFHNSLSTTMVLFMLACGLWGIVGAFRGGLSGSLSGALMIGQGLVLVQGLLGVVLYLAGARPANGLHWLYGASAAVTLPGVYSFVRHRSGRLQSLYLGFGALFIFGLAIRGITTGR